mgnify:CR=1 FL=1|jgi:hypothetical protein
MQTNTLPRYDDSINTTGCCAKFNPEGWDGQRLHFENKPFIRATTKSALHIPLNMGAVFDRVLGHINQVGGFDNSDYIVMSRELSPWKAEHLFATPKPVPDEEKSQLSGDFITKVFEGPFAEAKSWHDEMHAIVTREGGTPGDVYFFYTTCPKCAKAYGENYVVGVARL